MKKINLKRIKNGVYLLPFENPEPSGNEIKAFEQIEGLTRELSVKANYFAVTQVEPEHLLEGDPTEIMWENYFVLKPIKILDTS